MHFPTRFLIALLTVALLAASLIAPRAGAQSNSVDPVFGGPGLGLLGSVNQIALQSTGQVLVAGGSEGLVRLNTDGSTDTGFTPGVTSSGFLTVETLAVQTDDRIVLAGTATGPDNVAHSYVARLNADGTLDPGFNASANDAATYFEIALQPDGRILVASSVTNQDFSTTETLVRLNADGSADATFNPAFSSGISSFAVQPADFKIVLAGNFNVAGSGSVGLVRLNADGSQDTGFQPALAGNATSVTVQPDGRLLVASNNGLARLNTDGSSDASFNPSGFADPSGNTQLSSVADVLVQPDGKIFFRAYYYYPNLFRYSFVLSRANADGTKDMSFNVDVTAGDSRFPSPAVSTAALQADGGILVGGSFTTLNGEPRNSIARLLGDGTLDETFNPDTSSAGPNAYITGIALQPSGKLLVAGLFSQINLLVRNHVARLNTDGTPDASFTAQGNDGSFIRTVATQADGQIILGGDFTAINGTPQSCLARLTVDGDLDTTFGAQANLQVSSVVVQPDGKILAAGPFNQINGVTCNSLARVNADGTLDTSFNAAVGLGGAVDAMTVQADGKILLGGDFTEIDGEARQSLARLNADGSLDDQFQPDTGTDGKVLAITLNVDGTILIGGDFQQVDGTVQPYLARLFPDGTLDNSFPTQVNGAVSAIALQGTDSIVLGGSFAQINGVPRNGLARLKLDGSLDPFSYLDHGANGTVYALTLQPDGKMMVGGDFTSINGVMRNYVARLKTSSAPDFFAGQEPVGQGFYYLQFPDGVPFGFYNAEGNGYSFPYFFHADLGIEYFFDAQDGNAGAYLYDFASNTFFYTSPTFPFPYLYDFTLNTVLYYYPTPDFPGRYNTDGVRYFYDFATDEIISK